MLSSVLRHPVETADMFWNLIATKYERYHLSHFVMLVVITIYSLFGAICFCLMEQKNELRMLAERNHSQAINKEIARHRLISDMQYYFFRHVNVSALLNSNMTELLDAYDQQMAVNQPQARDIRYSDKPRWTIWGGLYYAWTIYTTIGYGDIVARTMAGRIFTIFYAIVGIPLVITVLNIWGSGLFSLMQTTWLKYFVRSANLIKSKATRSKKKQNIQVLDSDNEESEDGEESFIHPSDIHSQTSAQKSEVEQPKLPLKLAVFVIALWVLLCTVVFMFFQRWDFFTAFYFCSVSLTTVGLGDVTVDHKVAVINFVLIMVGLSVVSMSINVIQLHIEAVFARIIRSIDSDFKKNLTAEKRKISMATSINDMFVDRKSSTTVISIPVPTLQQQEEFRLRNSCSSLANATPEELDALHKYTNKMPVTDRFLVKLMSSHQKRLLNERAWERARMKNIGIQTEERKSSTSAQTDFVRRLNSLHTIQDFRKSTSISTESSEDEGDVEISQQAGNSTGKGGRGDAKIQRKRGLSRKKLYIYNIGD
ncbi:Potassium channel subfamily K member 18 [Aphelenchoides bicaudatus]|nr:Potassium channel subfamily K member 18 [Aphelenchoides bicaudatus]